MSNIMEDEILNIIAEQISLGYYSGTFSVRDDEKETYIDVNWDLNVNTYEEE